MGLLRTFRYARRYRNWREIIRARAAGRNPSQVVLRNGLRFEAPASVNAARAVNGIFFNRHYTPAGFEVRPGDHVVDVGANIGVFSVYAASRQAERVIAVEPFSENLECLRSNLTTNGSSQVEVAPAALSDRTGRSLLYLGSKGVTHQLFDRDEAGRLDSSVEVVTTTLERLLEEHRIERIGLLKLDCEGAEGLVLGSASATLLARIERITLEFHDYASPLSHQQLNALLERHGYRTRLRWNGRSSTGFLYATRGGT